MNIFSSFIISNIIVFKFALMAISGVLLEGIIVQKGDKWVKVKLLGQQFTAKKPATFWYFVEIIAIALIVIFFLGNIIGDWLAQYPIRVIIVFLILFWIKFNLQVWKTHGLGDLFKLK